MNDASLRGRVVALIIAALLSLAGASLVTATAEDIASVDVHPEYQRGLGFE
jgi:hypothetical protein